MNAVLLLHGALGSQSQLQALQLALESKGRIVYTMNFSGHSGEPFSPEGFGIEIFATDILHFLESRRLHQVDMVGYSMGGYVALWFAHQYPELIGKVITLGTKFDWNPESARHEVSKLDPEKIIAKVPAFARILEHRHTSSNWKELLLRTAEMMLGLGTSPLLTEAVLKKIKHPVLVCLGDRDDMADRDYSMAVAGMFPLGKFLALTNTPHSIEKVDLRKLAILVHGYLSEE